MRVEDQLRAALAGETPQACPSGPELRMLARHRQRVGALRGLAVSATALAAASVVVPIVRESSRSGGSARPATPPTVSTAPAVVPATTSMQSCTATSPCQASSSPASFHTRDPSVAAALADGRVTDAEYDAAADRVLTCFRVRFRSRITRETSEDGTHGFRIRLDADPAPNEVQTGHLSECQARFLTDIASKWSEQRSQ